MNRFPHNHDQIGNGGISGTNQISWGWDRVTEVGSVVKHAINFITNPYKGMSA